MHSKAKRVCSRVPSSPKELAKLDLNEGNREAAAAYMQEMWDSEHGCNLLFKDGLNSTERSLLAEAGVHPDLFDCVPDAPEYSVSLPENRNFIPTQIFTFQDLPIFPSLLDSSDSVIPKLSENPSSFPLHSMFPLLAASPVELSGEEDTNHGIVPEQSVELESEGTPPSNMEEMEEENEVDLVVEQEERPVEDTPQQNLTDGGHEIIEQGEVEVMQLEEGEEDDFRGFDELYVFQINGEDDDDDDEFEAFDMEEVEPPLMIGGPGQWGECGRRRG